MCYVCSGQNKKIFELLYKRFATETDTFVYFDSGMDLLSSLTSGAVHADILLTFCALNCLETEEHLIEHLTLLF